ncbi:hypothetical protein BASA50_000765 [Batrachochytrium salamandrivorans]|uniref:Uncharacterized protein n=1 Tax=Batrachochytrium salamandrivorans TaxID=1357716 RepID=A0ABQ8ETJ3_9FUNG|nr:hypothetical protein BASA50_000765 [Batrachochytrium salamandrivorans]
MKLISLFVAAMVITSVNAGLFGRLWRRVKNIRHKKLPVTFLLEPSSSPTPYPMSATVLQQIKDNPTLEHMFDDDPFHNGILIEMLNNQKQMLSLLNQVETECFKNVDSRLAQTTMDDDPTAKDLDENVNSSETIYKKVEDLLYIMYGCLSKFLELSSAYRMDYSTVPKSDILLDYGGLKAVVGLAKKYALNTVPVPTRKLLTSSHVDRQTAVADPFVIRTSIRAEAQGQPPVLRAPIISRHHCLEVTDRIAWLRGGVLNGEADLDQRWLDGTVEHESMGTRHDNRALAARLADFLQVAYRQYQSTLWKYHQGSPCRSCAKLTCNTHQAYA